MPVLESLDYDKFRYDEATQFPLTLDEAVKKAAELRRNDQSSFYRIEPVNEADNNFVIKKVPVGTVYAEFIARVTKLLGARFQLSR